jgi:hypothetical protein
MSLADFSWERGAEETGVARSIEQSKRKYSG